MSEPIQFFANVDSVQGGDEEVRIVLHLKDSPADLAAAVSMLGKLNTSLKVSAYLGTDTDALAAFSACIPQMKTGIQFRANRSPVIKLDIPASDGLSALRLVGYDERLIRFEVTDEGDRVRNGKKTPQKPKEAKGPYSYMWEYLNPNGKHPGRGFVTVPGVFEAIEEMRITETEPTWELLHRVFGVGGGTLVFTSDKEVLAKFPGNEKVELMIERAMTFQRDKEAKGQ